MNLSRKQRRARAKDKRKFLVAYAFTTVMFASDSAGYISAIGKIGTYEPLLDRMISGQTRGVSPDVLIREWECSICHKNYEKCPHEEGTLYNGISCQLIAKNIKFMGTSFVDEPKDPRCRVNDLLVIWEVGGAKLFEWYGFEVYTENLRFKNIEYARSQKLISQKAAFTLSEFFSVHLFGKVVFIEK